MFTVAIICVFIMIAIVGLARILRNISSLNNTYEFVTDYRAKFVEFANQYFRTRQQLGNGQLDQQLYFWLTKNVNQVQSILGTVGMMFYTGRFNEHQIPHYQIIINTLPKFKDGSVDSQEAVFSEDSLTRFIGDLELEIKAARQELRNPFVWFKDGFQTVLGVPIYLLRWFGILGVTSLKTFLHSPFLCCCKWNHSVSNSYQRGGYNNPRQGCNN
jgi:hypothetical protein